jgi:hypothetical protein
MPVNHEADGAEPAPLSPVPESAPEGSSVVRRLVPYASVAGALFLARIVVYALRRRKA